jgi:hypothetical protein
MQSLISYKPHAGNVELKTIRRYFRRLRAAALLGLTILSIHASALALTYNIGNLEMMLCFRHAGGGNPLDLEVNIGPASNLIALTPGTSMMISNYSFIQLSNAVASGALDRVTFSVTASAFGGTTNPLNVANDTIFVTVPRMDPSVPNPPWTREDRGVIAGPASSIYSIGSLAARYSRLYASDPLSNVGQVVGIPPGNPYSCEGYLGVAGDLNGAYFVIENFAPSPFSAPVVSDFFMEVPEFFPDPLNNNATNGPTTYLGYFTFSPDGSLSFTRGKQEAPVPPPPSELQLARNSGTSIISFTTTNGATYSLIYTNLSGLSAPRSTWPVLGTPVLGTGGVTNFIDSSATAERVYSVVAH